MIFFSKHICLKTLNNEIESKIGMNVPLMVTKITNLIEFELHVVSMPIDTYCIFYSVFGLKF